MNVKQFVLFATLLGGAPPVTFAEIHQSAKVTLNMKNVSIKEILSEVESQTSYLFITDNNVNLNKKVSVNVKASTVKNLLQQVLVKNGYTYEVKGHHIIVSEGLKLQKNRSDETSLVLRLNENKMIIKGRVLDDKTGEPIIGASVKARGSKQGTITNVNGEFSINSSSDLLDVSYIGYEMQQVRNIDGQPVIVRLKESSKDLDEVVVVGYGTVKKRDLTGAISTVKGSDLELAGVSSIAHALEGQAAGLYVKSNSAQPGGGLDILVRGAGSVNASNDPLYIVDGFPIAKLDQSSGGDAKMNPGTQGILNFLNPNDVESIEVLKDASASSIYGARASNGVIIITTKRGKEGKTRLSYSYNYSFQKYSDKYDLLSLKEWMVEKNSSSWEYWLWNNKVSPWGTKTLAEAQANPAGGIVYTRPYTDAEIESAGQGTDWLGLITRNGNIQEHNVNLQGGSTNTQYMLSLNYYNHEGIIKHSGMTRYTVKTNIDQKFLNIFKAGMNLTLTRIDNDNTQLGNGKFENSGIIRSAIQMGPNILAYDEKTGTYPINPLLGQQPNPYSLLTNTDKGRTDRLLGNLFLEARPLTGLLLRINAGIDHANMERDTYQPRTTLNGKNLNGVAYVYNTTNDQYLLEATATYQKTFAKVHNINVLAGVSYEKFDYKSHELGNNNFVTDAFLYNNIEAGSGTKIVKSTMTENKMLSYFFRMGYIYKDKYLLTTTLRADGASVFAKNNKWGYFPSVALGWTISNEDFMKNANFISNLKLRVSWGQIGNADITTNAFASYIANGSWVTADKATIIGVMKNRLDNPDLKWETGTEWNIGIDFGFLNSRISGTVEFYNKVTSDLLNFKPLNTYQEVKQVIANIGSTRSRGLEVSLNTRNIVSRDFSWSTFITYTKYKDVWKERTPDWKPNIYEKANDPIRPIYARRADHILQIGEKAPAAQPDLLPGQIVIKPVGGINLVHT